MKDKHDQQHLQSEEANSTLLKNVIRIDEGMIRDHLDQVVTKSVEQTLSALTLALGATNDSSTPRRGK